MASRRSPPIDASEKDTGICRVDELAKDFFVIPLKSSGSNVYWWVRFLFAVYSIMPQGEMMMI